MRQFWLIYDRNSLQSGKKNSRAEKKLVTMAKREIALQDINICQKLYNNITRTGFICLHVVAGTEMCNIEERTLF